MHYNLYSKKFVAPSPGTYTELSTYGIKNKLDYNLSNISLNFKTIICVLFITSLR